MVQLVIAEFVPRLLLFKAFDLKGGMCVCVQGMWFWGGGQRQGDYTDEEFGKNPNLEVGGLSKQIKDTSRGLFQEMHVSKD